VGERGRNRIIARAKTLQAPRSSGAGFMVEGVSRAQQHQLHWRACHTRSGHDALGDDRVDNALPDEQWCVHSKILTEYRTQQKVFTFLYQQVRNLNLSAKRSSKTPSGALACSG
jgi:hypothetical protein